MFIASCSIHLFGIGQNPKMLDSLIKISNAYTQLDSLKMRMLIRIYGEMVYLPHSNQQLIKYADSAKAIALKLPNKKNIQLLNARLGLVHHGKGDFMEALKYYQEGISICIKQNAKDNLAGYYMSMSDIYQKITDYTNAIDVCEKAIKIYTEINNQQGIASIYNNLSETYIALGDYETAYRYASKALPIFEKEGIYSRGVGSIKLILSNILLQADETTIQKLGYSGAKRYKQVIKFTNASIPVAELEKDYNLKAAIFIAMATAYEKLNQQATAKHYYEQAIEFGNKGFDHNSIAADYATVGIFFLRINNYNRGTMYLHQSLKMSTKAGLLEIEAKVCKSLSDYYERIKQFDSSLYYFKQFSVVSNLIFNKEKEKEITRKKLMFDFSVKEKEYAIQQERTNQQLAEKKLEIRFKNTLAWMMGILTIIVVLAAWFIYKSRKKTVELNATIESKRQSLVELVEVKDKIFSIITHDMRSPINSLISFVYLLEEDEVNKDQLALYAKELGNTLRGTSALMENLLNWAGSQLQGFDTTMELVRVNNIVSEVMESFASVLKQKQLKLQNSVDAQTTVWADKNMLALVIRNLLSNAIKFSYSGSTIHISTSMQNHELAIAIADEGIGMSEAYMKKMNDASIHNLTSSLGTNKEKGTGLGILLCKNFLTMMKGKLTAQQNEPKGSIMIIHLPLY